MREGQLKTILMRAHLMNLEWYLASPIDSLDGEGYFYIPSRNRGADTFSPEIKAGISGRF